MIFFSVLLCKMLPCPFYHHHFGFKPWRLKEKAEKRMTMKQGGMTEIKQQKSLWALSRLEIDRDVKKLKLTFKGIEKII